MVLLIVPRSVAVIQNTIEYDIFLEAMDASQQRAVTRSGTNVSPRNLPKFRPPSIACLPDRFFRKNRAGGLRKKKIPQNFFIKKNNFLLFFFFKNDIFYHFFYHSIGYLCYALGYKNHIFHICRFSVQAIAMFIANIILIFIF